MDKDTATTFFVLGISLVGVSIVFITNINKAIGIAFLAMGTIYMIFGIKKIKEHEAKEKKAKNKKSKKKSK